MRPVFLLSFPKSCVDARAVYFLHLNDAKHCPLYGLLIGGFLSLCCACMCVVSIYVVLHARKMCECVELSICCDLYAVSVFYVVHPRKLSEGRASHRSRSRTQTSAVIWHWTPLSEFM